MTREEAFKIINTEKECIKTCMQAGCNIECVGCDLSVDMTHLHDAYGIAIATLKEPEREHGYWIYHGEADENDNIDCSCSVCGAGETHATRVTVPYCWKCGAIMDGKDPMKNDTKSKEKETD